MDFIDQLLQDFTGYDTTPVIPSRPPDNQVTYKWDGTVVGIEDSSHMTLGDNIYSVFIQPNDRERHHQLLISTTEFFPQKFELDYCLGGQLFHGDVHIVRNGEYFTAFVWKSPKVLPFKRGEV